MGLLSKTTMMKWHPNNRKRYESLGYRFTKFGDQFEVNINDLPSGSNARILVQCDKCGIKKTLGYQDFNKRKNKPNYYCYDCLHKSIMPQQSMKTYWEQHKSFQQWCEENNRIDLLDNWDYELNYYQPTEILYSSTIKCWFKCPRHIHKSELKKINWLSQNKNTNISCTACNSFAQWGIDNMGEEFIKKYWSVKNVVDPWVISKHSSSKKIWIKCTVKNYHPDYQTTAAHFVNGVRCPYCKKIHGKVHPLDSLASIYPSVINVWSDKNAKTPFEYTPFSSCKVWWKCENNKHHDYKRIISNSTAQNFRCPKCMFSYGEDRIEKYLRIHHIDYTAQKSFRDLKDKSYLTYDFYIPQYNMLVEYQGEQHAHYIDYFHKSIDDLLKQKAHDRIKREYAIKNGYHYFPIWYFDIDNIEQKFDEEIQLIKEEYF